MIPEPITQEPFIGFTIPDRWQDGGVKAILSVGKFLSMQKDQLSTDDFRKYVRFDLKLDVSSVSKLIKIAENDILSDPENEDKLPPAWALLYELRMLPKPLLLEQLKAGKLRTITKYGIWELRGIKPPARGKPRKKRANWNDPNRSWIKAPKGVPLVDHVRTGMAAEKELNLNVEDAAKKIGIGIQSYRKIRSAIILADKPDLNEADAITAKYILGKINTTGRMEFYKEIEPIIQKIWGDEHRNRKLTDKVELKRVDNFKDSLSIICHACEKGLNIDIPYLSKADAAEAIDDLSEAQKALHQLIKNIRRETNG